MSGFGSVFELSKELSVLNRDNGKEFTDTRRLQAIKGLLKKSGYDKVNDHGLFYLYSKKKLSEIDKPLIVISSHIDCEEEITECFSREHEDNEKRIIGTYDNLITNAVILHHMLESNMPDNVVIGFTGDEEEDGKGAIELSEFLKEKGNMVAVVIVLDVTDRGWKEKAKFTLENNFWNDSVKDKVIGKIKNYKVKWKFVPSSLKKIPPELSPENIIYKKATEDETWKYYKKYNCFSFCIPVKGEMHSDDGVQIRKKSLVVYTNTLLDLINALSQ